MTQDGRKEERNHRKLMNVMDSFFVVDIMYLK